MTDVLPDTDGEGEPMSSHALAGRWQYNVAEVLKHLMKKHEGELAELTGRIFRPTQFACVRPFAASS